MPFQNLAEDAVARLINRLGLREHSRMTLHTPYGAHFMELVCQCMLHLRPSIEPHLSHHLILKHTPLSDSLEADSTSQRSVVGLRHSMLMKAVMVQNSLPRFRRRQ